jgi:23S rRNA pseudouridine1911/1915/1917 synthase
MLQFPELTSVGDPKAPAIVHRLDRDTSGLVLVARTNQAYQKLRQDFKKGLVKKEYLALVEGELAAPMEIRLPLGSRHRRSKKVQVLNGGQHLRNFRNAHTKVRPLVTTRDFSLCSIELITGFRHQIRAHLAYVGHPVVHDRQYGAVCNVDFLGERFFLHSWRLNFQHPNKNSLVTFSDPLPENLSNCLKYLKIHMALD